MPYFLLIANRVPESRTISKLTVLSLPWCQKASPNSWIREQWRVYQRNWKTKLHLTVCFCQWSIQPNQNVILWVDTVVWMGEWFSTCDFFPNRFWLNTLNRTARNDNSEKKGNCIFCRKIILTGPVALSYTELIWQTGCLAIAAILFSCFIYDDTFHTVPLQSSKLKNTILSHFFSLL